MRRYPKVQVKVVLTGLNYKILLMYKVKAGSLKSEEKG